MRRDRERGSQGEEAKAKAIMKPQEGKVGVRHEAIRCARREELSI